MKIAEYNQMMKNLTKGGPTRRSLAMQKDLQKNPKLTVDELVKKQTVDTSSLNQLIKKTQENIEFDKKHPPLISTKAMLENELLNPDEMLVKYDSATGLFINKNKSVAFKDVMSARKHNQIYETYSPTVQNLKKAVAPKATPAATKSKPFVKPKVKPQVNTQPLKLNVKPLQIMEAYKKSPEEKIAEQRFKKLMQDRKDEIIYNATSGLNSFKPASIQKEEIERSERTFNTNKENEYDL